MVHNKFDNEITKLNTAFGILCAHLSLLFFIKSPKSIDQSEHLDIDSRILFTFLDLSIEDNSTLDYLAEAICNTCIRFFEIHNIPYQLDDYYENRNDCLKQIFEIFDKIRI